MYCNILGVYSARGEEKMNENVMLLVDKGYTHAKHAGQFTFQRKIFTRHYVRHEEGPDGPSLKLVARLADAR